MFKPQSFSAQRRGLASRRRRRRAQTLVETALCLTFIVIPMFVAGIQFAIIINATHSLEEIAREGARFASVHGGETTFDSAVSQSNPPSMRNYIRTVCASTTIDYTDLIIGNAEPAAALRVSGQPITVRITYPMGNKLIFNPTTWANARYGGGAGQSYGTYMNYFNRNYVAASTFVLE